MLKEIWKVLVARVQRIKYLNPPQEGEGVEDYQVRAIYSLLTLAFFFAFVVLLNLSGWLELRVFHIIAMLFAVGGLVLIFMTMHRDEKLEHHKEAIERKKTNSRTSYEASQPQEMQRLRDWLIAFYGQHKDLVAHVIPPLFFQGYIRTTGIVYHRLSELQHLLVAVFTQATLRKLYEQYRPIIGDAYSQAHFEERLADVVGVVQAPDCDKAGRVFGLGFYGKAIEKELTDLYERLKVAAEAKKTETLAELKPSADIEAQIRDINASDYSEDLKAIQIAHLKNKHQETAS